MAVYVCQEGDETTDGAAEGRREGVSMLLNGPPRAGMDTSGELVEPGCWHWGTICSGQVQMLL